MALLSQPIANLIQGVSQQPAPQRRDSQAEAQFDCINSASSGAVARPGLEVISYSPINIAGAFCYEIYRSPTEYYVLVVSSGGSVRVFNLVTGAECSLSGWTPTIGAYLTVPDGWAARDLLRATTVQDYSFIGNTLVRPSMTGEASSVRPPEAIIQFRAGNYSTSYGVEVAYGGTSYGFTYNTPDNSVAGNAAYITTNALASAMSTALAALEPLGFHVAVRGSVIWLRRWDSDQFSIATSDGGGGTQLRASKGTVQSFSDLPKNAFDGFAIKVRGEDNTGDGDYYVAYRGDSESGGYWEETVGPGVATTINPATMPVQLINTGYNSFALSLPTWGKRVSGDETSSKSPSFIGAVITDLAFDKDRLVILHEGGVVFSKRGNPYSFFRDSNQTTLATDPVDIRVNGGRKRGASALRRYLQTGEASMLWAQKAQYRLTSNSDAFKQDTVEALPGTSYEFAEYHDPLPVGASLIFAANTGGYSRIRDLAFSRGTLAGETDVTAHVPRYIPSNVVELAAADSVSHLSVRVAADATRLWVYNWLIGSEGRLQSAWNIWRMPPGCTLQWHTGFGAYLYALVQAPTGVFLVRCGVDPDIPDDGMTDYRTRLDLRVSNSALAEPATYDAVNDITLLNFNHPVDYEWPSRLLVCAAPWVSPSGELVTRGTAIPLVSAAGNVMAVRGNVVGMPFYTGYRISSSRTESTFYLRTDKGPVPVDDLTVEEAVYTFAGTGYTRAEVSYSTGETQTYEADITQLGDPDLTLDTTLIKDGTFTVPIQCASDGYSLTLINDTHLPSKWLTAEVRYKAARRTVSPQGN